MSLVFFILYICKMKKIMKEKNQVVPDEVLSKEILYICKMKKIMKEKNQVVPDEVLSKEFISQFKTEADVSKFLKQLHAQVLEKMQVPEAVACPSIGKNA